MALYVNVVTNRVNQTDYLARIDVVGRPDWTNQVTTAYQGYQGNDFRHIIPWHAMHKSINGFLGSGGTTAAAYQMATGNPYNGNNPTGALRDYIVGRLTDVFSLLVNVWPGDAYENRSRGSLGAFTNRAYNSGTNTVYLSKTADFTQVEGMNNAYKAAGTTIYGGIDTKSGNLKSSGTARTSKIANSVNDFDRPEDVRTSVNTSYLEPLKDCYDDLMDWERAASWPTTPNTRPPFDCFDRMEKLNNLFANNYDRGWVTVWQ